MTNKEGTAAHSGPGFAETVILIAALTGMTSLSIDTMLPALPDMGTTYGITEANSLQLVVYVYMVGFALAQLFYGALSDTFGRRPVMMAGMAILVVGAALSAIAPSFGLMLAARFLQGVGAAAARVLTISIVRDRFEGREMARVMSFVMVVFILIPVLAPSFGGLILLFANWHWIFAAMAMASLLTLSWFALRMPETLHPEYRRPLSMTSVLEAARRCVVNREAVGYSTVIGLLFGTLMGYIASSEQIYGSVVYGLGDLFPLAFAAVSIAGGLSSYVNAHFVRRYGMRRLAHGSHIAHLLASLVLFAAALMLGGRPPLALFMGLLMVQQFFFSNMMANYNTMALDPLGAVAGMASSLIGAYTTLVGTIVGSSIGQSFDGTVLPLTAGTLGISALALGIVLWTERGKLFRPHHDPVRGPGRPGGH